MLGKKSPNGGFPWDRISKKSQYLNKQKIIIPISRVNVHQKVIHLFASHFPLKPKKLNPQLVSSLNLQGIQVCQITFRIHHLDTVVSVYGPFFVFCGWKTRFPKDLEKWYINKNTVPNWHKLFVSCPFFLEFIAEILGKPNFHSIPFSFSDLLTSEALRITYDYIRILEYPGIMTFSLNLKTPNWVQSIRLFRTQNSAFRPSGRSHCPWSCHYLALEMLRKSKSISMYN